jgi:hypothetical protein
MSRHLAGAVADIRGGLQEDRTWRHTLPAPPGRDWVTKRFWLAFHTAHRAGDTLQIAGFAKTTLPERLIAGRLLLGPENPNQLKVFTFDAARLAR